ncbi:E3 ubiquitin-protein ligase DTX4a [Periophthalmus magnuspinnatus]|uniref:E3 ubiquitin-protein ligase DTX4a n=1 Tax=Periophthalmus magnuspinnatus TaxID=409849 RepID=UPI00145A6D6A|nr:E3 ubiquitin-protein ligase DTX4a [Periophthalmus magnuspinnatus]XP_055084789.1 E3 ubiquitin-protein ligase DTX4a [Periophthalmus magnuspinnatus]
MLLASAVVVWEWLNEHGRWRPYSPAVCHHIEAVIRSDPRGASVLLGQVDSRLSPYIIDLQSMHQFRQDTGTLRPVRRSFYDPTSAPGQGWLWEWENDAGSWTAFDTEVGNAIQAARDRQQPWLDLAPLGFSYLIDFENMTQINGQTQRCRRIQRRSDLAYPMVSGPLPKSHQAWGPTSMSGTGGLLGVDVSSMGVRMNSSGNGSAYPSGALPASAITSLGQPCACQQCMMVLGVKTGALSSFSTVSSAQTLGRRPAQTKLPLPTISPKVHSYSVPGGSYSLTLPRPLTLQRTLPSHRTSVMGATGGYSVGGMGGPSVVGGGGVGGGYALGGGYGHSLSLLGSATAALSISSSRPPPPPLPPPAPPPPSLTPPSTAPNPTHPSLSSGLSVSCPAPASSSGPSLISTVSSTCAPSPSARVLGPVSLSGAPTCAAPLPPRSSLAGLSRPALQRIAMAQSRALIASGVPTVPVKNLNGSSPVHPALAGITGILMSAAGLPVCLTRPPKLVLHPPPVSKSDIKPVPGLGHCCRKTTKKQARKGKTPEEVVKRYLQKVRNPPEEDCTICMEALSGPSGYKGPGVGGISRAESVGRLTQCGHQYHLQCLVAMYNNGNKDGSLQCPTCKTIYGVKTGNQPPGKMEYHVIPHSLPGHPDCKAIRIIYNIPPGIQGPEHPNPGKPFTARGFPRHCYLPDSEKGRKVLRLLLVAWDRRLIFSVGTSSTTGESDTVIWNEVHHKTEFGSNLTGHGYPDPAHLDNVLEELKAQGITEDECLPRD